MFNKFIIIKGSDMLKKLAKYGNSSALVLDKAILELLGIEEGSVVKIKTDGVSIIITPHDKVAAEKISETYTAEQAQTEAAVKQFFKSYKKIDSAQQAKLEKELIALFEKQKSLSSKLFQQPDFMEELQKITIQKSGSDSRDV
jgi:antitoxin component of MazEF toxin-antitoxin module